MILFGAREHGFGRGIPGVSIVIFDEAQILTQDAVDDMVPAANQGQNPLIIYAGTPPKDTDPGEHFGRLRQATLNGDPDTLLIQLQPKRKIDPEKVDPATPEFWQAVEEANPSYPRFATPARRDPPHVQASPGAPGFILEGLAQWSEDSGPPLLVSKDDWSACKADDPIPAAGGIAVGITLARRHPGRRLCSPQARFPRPARRDARRVADHRGPRHPRNPAHHPGARLGMIVTDGKAGRDVLAPALLRARIPQRLVILPTVDQVIAANATYLTSIEDATTTPTNPDSTPRWPRSPSARSAPPAAGAWSRIGEGDEVPAEVAALAVWGTTKVRTRPRCREGSTERGNG